MSDALKRAKKAARAKANGRKPKPRTSSLAGTVKWNFIIPDIEFGAWSYIGQPPSPDSNIPDYLT